jgi:hypothetical protein
MDHKKIKPRIDRKIYTQNEISCKGWRLSMRLIEFFKKMIVKIRIGDKMSPSPKKKPIMQTAA